jgi:hypothetical protein
MDDEPIPSEALLEELVRWLERQRLRYRARGRVLDARERAALARYFLDDTLACVQVVMLPSFDGVARPPGYGALAAAERGLPIDLAGITGLTLVDTILVARPRLSEHNPPLSVIFQECVHVAQFRRLGTAGFLAAYLRGWSENGRRHDAIPLEALAAELRRRFETRPDAPFSVEAEVAQRLPAAAAVAA